MNYSGMSPKNPLDYRGATNGLVPAVVRARRPTSADYKQPETGKHYPITCVWQVGKDPTSGSEGELWMLSKIVANSASWVQLAIGAGTGTIASLTGDDSTTVLPDGAGNIDINATIVANATNGQAIYVAGTEADPVHKLDVELQLATTVSATPLDDTNVGVSCFNDSQFQIDTTSGMVSLVGSTTTPPTLMLALDDGNNATPDASGVITVSGTTVVNATNGTPLFTVRTPGTNDVDAEIQLATTSTSAAKDINKSGIIHLNSSQFTIDSATGFVSMIGSSSSPPMLTLTGDNAVVVSADGSGNIDLLGGTGITTTGTLNTITIDLDTPVAVVNGGTGSTGITGIVAGDGSAYNGRTLTAPAAGITITDPTGAAGDPTFALADDLAAVEGLSGTGLVSRTAANTWDTSSVTQYAVQVGDAGEKVASLSLGTLGEVLTSNGPGFNPSWQGIGASSGSGANLPTVIQIADAYDSNTDTTFTITIAPAAENHSLCVAIGAMANRTVSSITCTNVTFTEMISSSNTYSVFLYVGTVSGGTCGTTITITLSGGAEKFASVFEITDVLTPTANETDSQFVSSTSDDSTLLISSPTSNSLIMAATMSFQDGHENATINQDVLSTPCHAKYTLNGQHTVLAFLSFYIGYAPTSGSLTYASNRSILSSSSAYFNMAIATVT